MQHSEMPANMTIFFTIVRVLWGVFCIFCVFVNIHELINVTSHPEDYEGLFGTEGVLGVSPEAYINSIYRDLPWLLLGLITCFNWKSIWFRWGGGMHFIVSLALITKNCSA